MKKVIIVALLAIGLTTFAQEGKKKKGHQPTTEMRLKKMTEELSLTTEQQAKMASVLEEQDAIRKDDKENPDNKAENQKKMKGLMKRMNKILTPEQAEILKAKMEKGGKGKAKGEEEEGEDAPKAKKGKGKGKKAKSEDEGESNENKNDENQE